MVRKHNPWYKYLIIFIVGIILTVIYIASAGSWTTLVSYCNGLFISGAILILIAPLVLIDNEGFFNPFSYAFARKDPVTKRKPQYYDYCEMKKTKHEGKNYIAIPYAIIGAVYIVASLIILIFLPH